ncbi:unnamed protein product [Ixodes pacificus]
MQHLYLVGDFNIDILNTTNPIACDYLNVLSNAGIECVISAPTREEILGSKLVSSCIDHISIRTPNAQVESAVILEKLADHYFVACRLTDNLAFKSECGASRQAQIIDIVLFDKLVASYDWKGFLGSVNTTNVYPRFVEAFKTFTESAKRTNFKQT